MLQRRAVLQTLLKSAALFALRPLAGASLPDKSPLIPLRPGAGAPVEIPEEFIGLGYEMSSVAAPGLLSAANREYVALVQGLGSKGVLRVGGIVANYTRFNPQAAAQTDPHNTVNDQASLQQFAGFLNATGWRAIWSLNLAQGSLADAVTEAQAVDAALGPHLLAFELGNEVENYARGSHPFRPASWSYAAWRSEFREWSAAIRRALPHARFAAPDTASSVDWVENLAKDADAAVQLLTTHYYRADQRHGSAEQLLTPDPRLHDVLTRLRAASQHSQIPWRMCEANSFSGGGLPGVSDTIVGALWTLDFLLRLAAQGCAGVNIETGVNQLGFLSSYSPIRNDAPHAFAGIPYYGMLAFSQARKGCTQVLPIEPDLRAVNASAYVLGASGKPRSLIVVNRERAQEVRVGLRDLAMGKATVLRLTAPSPESTSGATFGGSAIGPDGHWSPSSKEEAPGEILTVPPMSAAVLRAME
ncbi:MAG TPA: glycosyl hydrolase family 79 C-terminal domain-containing protein [Acidobacteriaceae bacterium]